MCLAADNPQPQTEQASALSERADTSEFTGHTDTPPTADSVPEAVEQPDESEFTGHTDAPRAPQTDTPDLEKQTSTQPETSGTPVAQLQKRLGLLMPIEKRRKNT